ncbi:MAG: hypothetical protein ACK5MY_01215 [Jhaorihella sp.]
MGRLLRDIPGFHATASGRAWPLHGGTPPFARVIWREGAPHMTGDALCSLGTAIRNSATGAEEGVFARWRWDGARLTAEVDPLGFHTLFVYRKGAEIAVSPSLLQLVASGADTEPDRRALAVFYRLGLFLNDDTPLRHVRTLPPGGRLVWESGQAAITGEPFIPAERSIDRNGAVQGFIDLTRASLANIAETWPGEFVLPLSGGRDSRHILLALDHLGRRPRACVTFQHENGGLNAEARAARAICESVGVPHLILGRPRARARDILRALVLTGLCSDEHAQMLPMHDYLAGRAEAALDGIGGDILTNPDDDAEGHFRLARQYDFHGIARAMIAGHARVISKSGHGPGMIYAPDDEEEAVDYIARTVARFADAPDPYQAFWFWNRTRREVGFVSSALFGGAAAVFCPFLDRRFVEFGLSLPYAVTRDQKLHDDAIARGYPDHAGVPFAEAIAPGGAASGGPRSRLRQAAFGVRTLAALRPARPLRALAAYLGGSPHLHRRPAEILQQYHLALSGLDAAGAQRLLALAAGWRHADAGDQISDRFEPGSSDAG